MEQLEGDRLARQCDFLLSIFRPVVRNRKEEASGGPDGVLVVEPHRLVVVADLLSAQARLGVHLRLRIHVDSLRPQSHHPPPAQRSAAHLPGVRCGQPAFGKLLRELRGEASTVTKKFRQCGIDHWREDYSPFFAGDGAGAGADAAGLIPYLSRMGLISGWLRAKSCSRVMNVLTIGRLTVSKSCVIFFAVSNSFRRIRS